MDIAVAIQAPPGKHLIGRRGSLERFKSGINGARVTGTVMTALAEQRHPGVQKFVMI